MFPGRYKNLKKMDMECASRGAIWGLQPDPLSLSGLNFRCRKFLPGWIKGMLSHGIFNKSCTKAEKKKTRKGLFPQGK